MEFGEEPHSLIVLWASRHKGNHLGDGEKKVNGKGFVSSGLNFISLPDGLLLVRLMGDWAFRIEEEV